MVNMTESAQEFSLKKPKILWISHFLPYPPRGGALIRSYHLLSELSKSHAIDLISFGQKRLVTDYYPNFDDGIGEIQSRLSAIVNVKKVFPTPHEERFWSKELTALRSMLSMTPYTIRYLQSQEVGTYIKREIDIGDYDLLHFDTISLASYLPEALQVPALLNHHNVESHMMFRRMMNEGNLIRKAYYYQEAMKLRAYEQKCLPKFSAHIVCSEDDKSRLLSIDGSLCVDVIPNGISIDNILTSERETTSPYKLIFIGGLDWYPNRDAVLHFLGKIWPLLKRKRADIEFHIVGKNPPTEITEISRLDSKVIVHGFVRDVSQIYRSAAVYICPIRDGGGTKLKVLDALAHGVPLVGYAAACEGIDIRSGQHALIAGSPSEFAEQVDHLLSHPVDAERIAKNGRRLIRDKYNVISIGLKLANLYSTLRESRAR